MDPERHEHFAAWLRERGVEEPRRIVRESPGGILVSKFPAGFSAQLHGTVDRLDALFSDDDVRVRAQALGEADPGLPRVEAWHRAVLAVLHEAEEAGLVTARERAEVEAGVDSVAALLDTALWSGPTCGEAGWQPAPGEITAFREALARMEESDGLFSRYYGTFDGIPVENHCPGVSVARRLLQQAWVTCTGQPLPADSQPAN